MPRVGQRSFCRVLDVRLRCVARSSTRAGHSSQWFLCSRSFVCAGRFRCRVPRSSDRPGNDTCCLGPFLRVPCWLSTARRLVAGPPIVVGQATQPKKRTAGLSIACRTVVRRASGVTLIFRKNGRFFCCRQSENCCRNVPSTGRWEPSCFWSSPWRWRPRDGRTKRRTSTRSSGGLRTARSRDRPSGEERGVLYPIRVYVVYRPACLDGTGTRSAGHDMQRLRRRCPGFCSIVAVFR